MDHERMKEITERLSASMRKAVQAELRRGMRRAARSPSRITAPSGDAR